MSSVQSKIVTSTNTIVVLLVLFAAGVLNCYAGSAGYPSLCFTNPLANTLAFLLMLALPWFAFAAVVARQPSTRPWRRRLLLTVLVLLMLTSIPAAIGELLFAGSDEVTKSVQMDDYQVRLHLLDCGAVCSFALAVDQERVVVPSLILWKRLAYFDEAEDAKLTVVGKNELRVETLPYTEDQPNVRIEVFRMKPFFFF